MKEIHEFALFYRVKAFCKPEFHSKTFEINYLSILVNNMGVVNLCFPI